MKTRDIKVGGLYGVTGSRGGLLHRTLKVEVLEIGLPVNRFSDVGWRYSNTPTHQIKAGVRVRVLGTFYTKTPPFGFVPRTNEAGEEEAGESVLESRDITAPWEVLLPRLEEQAERFNERSKEKEHARELVQAFKDAGIDGVAITPYWHPSDYDNPIRLSVEAAEEILSKIADIFKGEGG